MAVQMPTATTLDVRTMGGISGKCALISDGAGLVAANSTTQAFIDVIGVGATSNIIQTAADSNMASGAIPVSEVYTVFGFQIQLGVLLANNTQFDTVANVPANVIQDALNAISMTLNIKGQNYPIGSLMTMPAQQGWGTTTNGVGYPLNGGKNVPTFRFPPELALQLGSNDTYSLRFTAERAFNLTTANSRLLIWIYNAASRGISVGQLSGA